MEIVVHAGTTKTGSTHLQHVFEHNRTALRSHGILFPVSLFSRVTGREETGGHDLIGNWNRRGELAAEIVHAGRGVDKVLLSSEMLWWHYILNSANGTHNLDRIFRFLSSLADSVRVVFYVRRQDHWLDSQYRQVITRGRKFDCTIMEFADLMCDAMDVFKWLGAWADIIGKENIFVRVYDRSRLVSGDIVADMCACLGMDSNQVVRPEGLGENRSLPAEAVQFMRSYGPILNSMPRELKLTVCDYLMAEHGAFRNGPLMSRKQRIELLCKYRDSNCNAAEAFCGDRRLPLFEENVIDDVEYVSDGPVHISSNIVRNVNEIIGRFLVQGRRLETHSSSWSRRLGWIERFMRRKPGGPQGL